MPFGLSDVISCLSDSIEKVGNAQLSINASVFATLCSVIFSLSIFFRVVDAGGTEDVCGYGIIGLVLSLLSEGGAFFARGFIDPLSFSRISERSSLWLVCDKRSNQLKHLLRPMMP